MINIKEVPTGTKVFDWEIPKEWNIKEAYIEDEDGNRIIDFKENNLHVMGYSTSVDRYVDKEELLKYVYVEESMPDAVPYVTSYYKERYGFCMSKNMRDSLKYGRYHMYIDSTLKDGYLTYGEAIVKGKTDKEVFISTYICHPSLANDNCSGPALTLFLLKYVMNMTDRKYTYRFVFIPETIGSITYLSKNYKYLKENVIAGFNLTCVGDDRTYSFVETRYANTFTDRVLKNVLGYHYPNYKRYSYLQRGSDERQYCLDGIDIPICSVCRSKFGEYPEYHTSLDNMELVSEEGFAGSYELMIKCIITIEKNESYKMNCLCEPQLGKRGLYPTVSKKGQYDDVYKLTNIIAYADGSNDLIDISEIIGVPVWEIIENVEKLVESGLVKICGGNLIKM